MWIYVDDELWVLADHILMDHERETPGYWTYEELDDMHREMHVRGDHWNHKHRG